MAASTDVCKQQRELEEDYDKRSEDESMSEALLDTPSDEELGAPKPPPPLHRQPCLRGHRSQFKARLQLRQLPPGGRRQNPKGIAPTLP